MVERSSLSLELDEGNCQVVRLTVRLNGRVRGRIFNAAGIPPGAVTLILDAGIAYGGPGLEVRTTHAPFSETGLNPDGTFEFTGVAPASYVLIARYARAAGTPPENVVTYFPGTRDLAEALRIDVGRATEHVGLDFAIATEAAITSRRLTTSSPPLCTLRHTRPRASLQRYGSGDVQNAQRRAAIGTWLRHSGHFRVVGSGVSSARLMRSTMALAGATTRKYIAAATSVNEMTALMK